MKDIILKAENISKQYRLGVVGTGTLSHDLNRWWHKLRGKEDPYLKVGEANDRSIKGTSEYVWALQDINFEVERGEVLGIIGKNGAGKSTLLKILSKVTSPTTGVIKSRGRIASLLEVGTGFNPELTGRENIYLNGAILGMTKKEIAFKIDEIIAFSGCERYIDTPTKRYSSGMTVRLAFAVAAFLEPEILVVDEVLAVGDTEFQKKAIGKMQDISKSEGRTVLFVSHNMAAVKSLCTRGIVMENGKVAYNGDVEEALKNYILSNEVKNNNLQISKGVFDLTLHNSKKRKDNGLQKVEVYCNSKLSDIVYNNTNVEFIISYITDRDLYSGEVGIVIKDRDDFSYIGINNKHIGKELLFKKGDGQVKISIPNFPIYSKNEIVVNFYFGDLDFKKYEILENAIVLKSEVNDTYKSGKLLDLRYNKICISNIEINKI